MDKLNRQICVSEALGRYRFGKLGIQVSVTTVRVCEVCQGGHVEQKEKRASGKMREYRDLWSGQWLGRWPRRKD